MQKRQTGCLKWPYKQLFSMKRRGVKGKGEKGRHTHLNEEFQRIAKRDKKAFHSDQYEKKKREKKIEWERLQISSRKLEIPREIFMQRWPQYRTEMI